MSEQKKSLKQSIFVFIYSFVFCLSCGFFIPSFIQQQQFIKQELKERGKSLTRNLALNCQKVLEQNDLNSLFMLADSLMRENDILWVVVIDSKNQVVAQNGTVDFEFLVPQLKKLKAVEKISLEMVRMADGKMVDNNYIGIRKAGLDNASMVNKELSLLEGFGGETGADKTEKQSTAFLGVVHVGVSMQRLHEVQRKIAVQMFILLILAIAGSTLVGAYFARFLLAPINQFIGMMKDIASRRGDLTQRLVLGRNDEFGEMAKYFNVFIQNVAQIVKDTVQLVAKMNVSLEEISSTSEQLSANADGVNITVQGVTNDLEKQERESTTTNNTIEQVLTTILAITSKSQDAYRVSAETEKVSRDSSKVIQDSVRMINGVAGQMSVIEERMQRLKKSLGGIGGFVESIKKIASQTNLLSLNAAIEAARAGEAGRGFSVVAEEVRKLAEDSASASEQIQNLIEKIELEVQGTSDATRQGSQVVAQGSKMIDQAGVAFETIMRSAEHSAGVSEEISKSLQQQSNSLKSIIQQVDNVKQLVKNNFIGAQSVAASIEEQTASFEQITTAIQKLSEDAQNIRRLVVEFKIN